jgi:hypothetical protein
LETGPKKIIQAERSHTDMRIVPNVVEVIKDKWRGQGIGINQDDNDRQQSYL